jgi:DNA-binding response OmpR family regulator
MAEHVHNQAMAMVLPQTILVIDDDPDIRGDLQMLLEDHGYRVITAPDGQSGLTRAINERPSLVIVDMMMPKMSGFIVLERLKQNEARRTPVIMLTGNESDQQRAFAEFLGVDAYLNKPVATKHLLDRVRQFCPARPDDTTAIPANTAV